MCYNNDMKISVSARLDETLVNYLDSYRQNHGVKNRSEALEQAIRALRERNLEQEYEAATKEWNDSGEANIWDKTAGDGLNKEPYEAW